MTAEGVRPVRVECLTCGYTRVVEPADDLLAADIIIEHGRKTGHRLTATGLDAGDGVPGPD